FLNLVDWLLAENNINFERKISELTKKEELNLVESLTNLKLEIIGNDGLKKAIATAGGVDLNEVDSKTLAAKKFNNLFFAGEVLDIDGRCGGYNLTWAFASGAKVATEIRKLCK
ncbi:MAG: NAD(P)/FAD-dependent oxidoreductase, partial [Lentisphaeria bacterium]|nr:NAD(P)/FAD-dependent oxidoreductase [Lentisphaeria bacterium]